MERRFLGIAAAVLLATETLTNPRPTDAANQTSQNETTVLGGMVANGNRLEARVLCLEEDQTVGLYIESPQVVYIDGQRHDYPRNLVEVIGNRDSGLSVISVFMTDNTDLTIGRGSVGRISWKDQSRGHVTFIDPERLQFNPGTQIVNIEGNLTKSNIRAGLTHSCYGSKSS